MVNQYDAESGGLGNPTGAGGGGNPANAQVIPYPSEVPPGYTVKYEYNPNFQVWVGVLVPAPQQEQQARLPQASSPTGILQNWPQEDAPPGHEWAWNYSLNGGNGGWTAMRVPDDTPRTWEALTVDALVDGDWETAQGYFDFWNQLGPGEKLEMAFRLSSTPGDYATYWSLLHGSQSAVGFDPGARRIPFAELLANAGMDAGILTGGGVPPALTQPVAPPVNTTSGDNVPGIEEQPQVPALPPQLVDDPTADIHGAPVRPGAAPVPSIENQGLVPDNSVGIEQQGNVPSVLPTYRPTRPMEEAVNPTVLPTNILNTPVRPPGGFTGPGGPEDAGMVNRFSSAMMMEENADDDEIEAIIRSPNRPVPPPWRQPATQLPTGNSQPRPMAETLPTRAPSPSVPVISKVPGSGYDSQGEVSYKRQGDTWVEGTIVDGQFKPTGNTNPVQKGYDKFIERQNA